MTEFTPLMSFAGGALIGLAAVLLMALHGRIAGISGILQNLLPPVSSGWDWRLSFVIGAVAAPLIATFGFGADIAYAAEVPVLWIIIGGLIAGVGITFGAGCTSGHGICGNARLSRRSIVATLTFMATAIATVFVIRHIFGGF